MDWTVPESSENPAISIGNDNGNGVVVVYSCWRAAERHYSEGKFGEAVWILAKLICSRFASITRPLEIGSRMRLAALCCTDSSLTKLATEQLNRIWVLVADSKDAESVKIKLLCLKYLEIAQRTDYEAHKTQSKLGLCQQTILQALQLCLAHLLDAPDFFVYFSIRRMDLDHISGVSDDLAPAIEKATKSLELVTSRRTFKSKSLSVQETYRKQQVAGIAVLKIRKILHYVEEGHNQLAQQELARFGLETSHPISNIPEIIDLLEILRVSVLFQESRFADVMKSLGKMPTDNFFRKSLLPACLRYIGSTKAIQEFDTLACDGLANQYADQTQHLSGLESKFTIHLQMGNLVQSLRFLESFRHSVLEYCPFGIPGKWQAIYFTMNGVLGCALGLFEFALHCFSIARDMATSPSDHQTLDLHIHLATLQSGTATDYNGPKVSEIANGPAHLWFLPKAQSLLDFGENGALLEAEMPSEAVQQTGSLHLAIWSKINNSQKSLSQAIGMAKKASYCEGEYHAYKKMLINAHQEGNQPGSSADETWSKQRAILISYRHQVDQILSKSV